MSEPWYLKRSAMVMKPITKNERRAFFKCMEKYKHLLNSPLSKNRSVAWKYFRNDFNRELEFPRTVLQLRKFWGNVKRGLKKKIKKNGPKAVCNFTANDQEAIRYINLNYFEGATDVKELTENLHCIGLIAMSSEVPIADDVLPIEEVYESNNGIGMEKEEEENPLKLPNSDQVSDDDRYRFDNSNLNLECSSLQSNDHNYSTGKDYDSMFTREEEINIGEMIYVTDETLFPVKEENILMNEIDGSLHLNNVSSDSETNGKAGFSATSSTSSSGQIQRPMITSVKSLNSELSAFPDSELPTTKEKPPVEASMPTSITNILGSKMHLLLRQIEMQEERHRLQMATLQKERKMKEELHQMEMKILQQKLIMLQNGHFQSFGVSNYL